jgi:hypothetical protein
MWLESLRVADHTFMLRARQERFFPFFMPGDCTWHEGDAIPFYLNTYTAFLK